MVCHSLIGQIFDNDGDIGSNSKLSMVSIKDGKLQLKET